MTNPQLTEFVVSRFEDSIKKLLCVGFFEILKCSSSLVLKSIDRCYHGDSNGRRLVILLESRGLEVQVGTGVTPIECFYPTFDIAVLLQRDRVTSIAMINDHCR